MPAARHEPGRRSIPVMSDTTEPAEPALEEIERILRDGNGADRMRAAHAEGGMPRVLHRLIEESAEALGMRGRAA